MLEKVSSGSLLLDMHSYFSVWLNLTNVPDPGDHGRPTAGTQIHLEVTEEF